MDKKTALAIGTVSLGVIFTPIFIWGKTFGLSSGGNTESWSHFGSFFSGVVGPLLAWFSLIGVLITLRSQSNSNLQQAIANERAEKDRLIALQAEQLRDEEQAKRFELQFNRELWVLTSNTVIDMLNKLDVMLEGARDVAYELALSKSKDEPTKRQQLTLKMARSSQKIAMINSIWPRDIDTYPKELRALIRLNLFNATVYYEDLINQVESCDGIYGSYAKHIETAQRGERVAKELFEQVANP